MMGLAAKAYARDIETNPGKAAFNIYNGTQKGCHAP
jgi:hypothetical protein